MSVQQKSILMDLSIGAIIPFPTHFDELNSVKKLVEHHSGNAEICLGGTQSSEDIIMEQSPCTDGLLLANQLNHGVIGHLPGPADMIIRQSAHVEGSHDKILLEFTPSSEDIIMEQSSCTDGLLFANQLNHELIAVEPQHLQPVDMMIENSARVEGSHSEISIEQLLGHEEIWFDDTPQCEEFWLTQLPDYEDVTNLMSQSIQEISVQQLQDHTAICFEQAPESVVETQNEIR